MIYLGLDPGSSGGIAMIDDSGEATALSLVNKTEHDIAGFIETDPAAKYMAIIERVGATPQMGVVSAFTFGQAYGFVRGLLAAYRIPFEEVHPQSWQKEVGAWIAPPKKIKDMSPKEKSDWQREKKNHFKAVAQRLFPSLKVTLGTADALLLAEVCRRRANHQTPPPDAPAAPPASRKPSARPSKPWDARRGSKTLF